MDDIEYLKNGILFLSEAANDDKERTMTALTKALEALVIAQDSLEDCHRAFTAREIVGKAHAELKACIEEHVMIKIQDVPVRDAHITHESYLYACRNLLHKAIKEKDNA